MANDNKAVGPLASARLVTLIKAETAKKYDKTGGKIEGSAEITGGLKVGMSSEFSSSIKAESEISSDMLLMAPIVALYDPAKEESISFGVSGENAAKVTSPVSGGGIQYARLAVGTPTRDNDAATKAYVDGLAAAGYGVIIVTSTNVSDLGYDASEGANRYSVTFDASFDSILANLAANKPIKFNITLPDSTGGFPVSFSTGYVSALNDSDYLFTGTILKYPVVLRIGALGSATVYLYGAYLPEPNPDDSDDGKVLSVNKHKWEIKAIPVGSVTVDAAMSSTSTNPVQNKVIKQYVDDHAADGAVLYTAQTLTYDQKFQARKNIGALSRELPVTTGPVSLCPANVTDNNDAVHLTTTKYSGDDFTLTLDCGPENALVRVDGIRTPTDADTDAAANVEYVLNKLAGATDGTVDAVMSDTSTNAVQNKVIKKYVDDIAGKKLNQTEPLIKEGLTIKNTANFAIRAQPDGITSATGEDFASLDFSDYSPQGIGAGIVISGLANFGDAEAVGLEDTAVSYAQLVAYTTPLTLTYDNNQVTGASYADIRKAITRGRQIKLAVSNLLDIIATNAKNEADKSVLKFVDTDVVGDTVSIAQYTVTAQASGLTCNVKSHELA